MASANILSLERGQKDSVEISILRSRSFRTGKATISVSSPAVAGIVATIIPIANKPDNYFMLLTAGNEAQPGGYNVIPNCTLRNKTKGIVVKLIIK
jgi:hypothetical protein